MALSNTTAFIYLFHSDRSDTLFTFQFLRGLPENMYNNRIRISIRLYSRMFQGKCSRKTASDREFTNIQFTNLAISDVTYRFKKIQYSIRHFENTPTRNTLWQTLSCRFGDRGFAQFTKGSSRLGKYFRTAKHRFVR